VAMAWRTQIPGLTDISPELRMMASGLVGRA
jgi:hypothetical protein